MQTDPQVSDNLIFFGIHLEELGLWVEVSQFCRGTCLLLAMRFDGVFEFGLASQLFGKTLVIALPQVLQSSAIPATAISDIICSN